MNKTIELLKNRRSIRSYKPDMVKKEDLDLILDAAIWAPSSHNTQPWYFTVIKNEGIGKELNSAAKDVLINSDNEMLRKLGQREDLFYKAPIIVIVSGKDKYKSSIIDCSAAVENMLIAAESIGLGTCWNSLVSNLFRENPNHEVMKKLEIPEGYSPFYGVAIGYPDKKQKPPKRKGEVIKFLF